MKTCNSCEHLNTSRSPDCGHPELDRIVYGCNNTENRWTISIRRCGRVEGPDEPWHPRPEILWLIGISGMDDAEKKKALEWAAAERIPGSLHRGLRKLRIRLYDEFRGDMPVMMPHWCSGGAVT